MRDLPKYVFYAMLISFVGLFFFDYMKVTQYRDDVAFQSTLATDYVVSNARDAVASSTGFTGDAATVKLKIHDAFKDFLRSKFPDGNFIRECTTSGDTTNCRIKLDVSNEAPYNQFRLQMLDGPMTFKLVTVVIPQDSTGYNNIFGIGISVRRDMMSFSNWGMAAGYTRTTEDQLRKLTLRADRKTYIISSY